MLNILMAHNRYIIPGGEDFSTLTETNMLRNAGHNVDLWEVSNDSVGDSSLLATGINAIWSRSAVRELEKRLNSRRYDLLHVQNHFPLLSPAVHRAAAKQNVATVQHLRNYRMMCANAGFFRNGQQCDDCKSSFAPWRGVVRGCYRDSALASLVPTAIVAAHKALGTFSRDIDAYIAISEHVRQIHCQNSFPSDRVFMRYNAVAQVDGPAVKHREPTLIVASRLTPEKGIGNLISAWRKRPREGMLKIAGSGPQEQDLRFMADGDDTIEFLGQVSFEKLGSLMRRSLAVVNCCLWDEPFGRTMVEAFSCGTPVIASPTGGLKESVEHQVNGLLVNPGDLDALDNAISQFLTDDKLVRHLQSGAIETYQRKFATDVILSATEKIYEAALRRRRQLSS